ncbi:MAG: hypothetical protein KJ630_02460 [Proteobacteria bacterium]|nr:hypothetical protein [Pseudomonadota bacterium]
MIINKALTFIHSYPNTVGCTLGLLGLALHSRGIVSSNWQLIVIGLYLFGYLVTPNPPEISPKETKTLSPSELMLSLNELVRRVKLRLPQDIMDCVVEIRNELDSILQRFEEIKQDLHCTHLVHHITLVYLPKILDTYLKIPAKDANIHQTRSGQTPSEMAMDQLQLLLSELREISTTLTRKSIQDLKIHQNFLKAKFREDTDS